MRVLITVKAAPNPSATYGETVCVAGLRLDLDAAGWVRHYPINFREFDSDGKFRTAATWQRRSAGARQALAPPPNGSCVEVAQTSAGTIAVRDTTDRRGPALAFSPAPWWALTVTISMCY